MSALRLAGLLMAALFFESCRSSGVAVKPYQAGDLTTLGYFSRLCADQKGPWRFPANGRIYECNSGIVAVYAGDGGMVTDSSTTGSLELGARRYECWRGDGGQVDWSEHGCHFTCFAGEITWKEESPNACRAVGSSMQFQSSAE